MPELRGAWLEIWRRPRLWQFHAVSLDCFRNPEGPFVPPEDGFWGVNRDLSTSLEGTWTLCARQKPRLRSPCTIRLKKERDAIYKEIRSASPKVGLTFDVFESGEWLAVFGITSLWLGRGVSPPSSHPVPTMGTQNF